MYLGFDETDGYGLSGRIWAGKFAPPIGGQFQQTASGNPAFGTFDTFLDWGNTSLYAGKILLATATCAVQQIASELHHPGILQNYVVGDTANDECVWQYGAGLDTGPYSCSGAGCLAFEAYMRVSATTASKWSWFVGLATGGSSGAAITDKMFADSTGALYATNGFLGFQKLYAESTALDAMYQESGGTKVDGAVNTDLDTIHTLVATGWVKLGFRVDRYPRKCTWFVNGREVCSVNEAAIAAVGWPDASYLQPTIGIKDIAGNATVNLDCDWIACAQEVY